MKAYDFALKIQAMVRDLDGEGLKTTLDAAREAGFTQRAILAAVQENDMQTGTRTPMPRERLIEHLKTARAEIEPTPPTWNGRHTHNDVRELGKILADKGWDVDLDFDTRIRLAVEQRAKALLLPESGTPTSTDIRLAVAVDPEIINKVAGKTPWAASGKNATFADDPKSPAGAEKIVNLVQKIAETEKNFGVLNGASNMLPMYYDARSVLDKAAGAKPVAPQPKEKTLFSSIMGKLGRLTEKKLALRTP